MAAKSALLKYFWWIDESEIGEDKPTAFKLRQMSKKDIDEQEERTRGVALLQALRSRLSDDEAQAETKATLDKILSSGAFNSALYRSCVAEIKNIYVDGEFFETITDVDEIVKAIAGLEDEGLGRRLDSVIYRSSTLEPFEAQNFTSPSGSVPVCKTATESQPSDQ